MLSLRNEWRDSADSVENLAALHALRLSPMKKPRGEKFTRASSVHALRLDRVRGGRFIGAY